MKRVCLFMTLICMMMVSCKLDGSDGKHEGHGYVDLGLSVKWATCNVGASKPEDYGHYFAWGETTTKSSYTESNSKTYGKKMGDIAGNSSYDAATANWGGSWRMPTDAEMQELIDKCTWKWTTQNGSGILLERSGKRYSGKPDGDSRNARKERLQVNKTTRLQVLVRSEELFFSH